MLPCHDARSGILSGTHSTAVEYQAIWVKSSIWAAFNENLCGKKAFISRGSYCISGGQLASITLNFCVTDTCGGISSAPAISYKCLL